jgi:hypothetical protein
VYTSILEYEYLIYLTASAIAGSLRTSTAPTGSRTLLPPGILPLRLGAQPSSGRRRGAPGPVAGQPAQLRANAAAVLLHSFSDGSLGRGDRAAIPLGGQSSCWSTLWSTRSQVQRHPGLCSGGPECSGPSILIFQVLHLFRSWQCQTYATRGENNVCNTPQGWISTVPERQSNGFCYASE